MKCPACNVNLVMTERKGVEIDYCPDCRGVWLDRGELDKIVERSSDEQGPSHHGNYGHKHGNPSYQDKDFYKRKRRDSFLGELFDF